MKPEQRQEFTELLIRYNKVAQPLKADIDTTVFDHLTILEDMGYVQSFVSGVRFGFLRAGIQDTLYADIANILITIQTLLERYGDGRDESIKLDRMKRILRRIEEHQNL